MNIKNVDSNFDEDVINYKGIAIVDFWAEWCGPCKMFAPIFEEVANNNNKIKFCKLNVDNDKISISKKLGVMSIPTTIIFKDGKEIKRNIGFLTEEDLINFIGDIDV